MIRSALASYWTACALWAALTASHGFWLARSDHAGEVLSGYGAGLVVLGVLIGSRPYIGVGLRETAARQSAFRALVINTDEHGGDFDAAVAAARQERVAEVMPGLIDERVVAVGVVILGTLLNGYGTPIARLCRWPV